MTTSERTEGAGEVALSEDEREDFRRNLRQNLGYRAFVIEDTMLGHVERILARRALPTAGRVVEAERVAEQVDALADEFDAHADRMYDEARWADRPAAIVLRSKSGTYRVNAERLRALADAIRAGGAE